MVHGRSYTLAGKYKGVRWFNGEIYISPRLYAGIEWLTASGSRISVKYVLNSTTVTNPNWVNFGGAHTAPTNAVKARIILFNYLSPNTEARFDNISLEKANQTYRYDANGNIIQDLNRNISSITYNRLNLPVRMVKTNGTVISYGYNWSGQRLWKITSGTDTTKYIRLASGSILGEWNTTNGGFSFISLAGVTSSSIGYRVLESRTWKRYFYITDHASTPLSAGLGNIRNQIKETGAIVYSATYAKHPALDGFSIRIRSERVAGNFA